MQGREPRREQTEHDVSRGTHHVINPSRPSPAFRTASWAWRPGNKARAGRVYLVSFPDHFSPHGKNWSGEQPIPFSFPAVAKYVT